jgi:peptidyl-prolyl cis-trans isomerase C
MSKRILFYITGLLCCGLVVSLLAGCKPAGPIQTQVPRTSEVTPAALDTPTSPDSSPSPLPTDVPLAARVNGFAIPLTEYQAELAMYKAAKGTELAPEDEKRALEDLIDQVLLAKGAEEKGYSVDDALIDKRMKALNDQLGNPQAVADWRAGYGFDEATFRQALSISIAAAWMRDQIAESVPKTAEQVHARQILLYSADQANQVYAQLQAGNSFKNLALKYDPITGGDLGWFPRGYLPDKKIEEAAFGLQPDQYSQIIETPAGFHILQTLEVDAARPLSPDARLVLQTQAIKDWVDQQRSKAEIEVLQP